MRKIQLARVMHKAKKKTRPPARRHHCQSGPVLQWKSMVGTAPCGTNASRYSKRWQRRTPRKSFHNSAGATSRHSPNLQGTLRLHLSTRTQLAIYTWTQIGNQPHEVASAAPVSHGNLTSHIAFHTQKSYESIMPHRL